MAQLVNVIEPIFTSEPDMFKHTIFYWEHEGGRAVRHGDWKLAALPDGEWELFDLSRDRGESRDVSARHPQKVAELAALWTAWRSGCHRRKRDRGVSIPVRARPGLTPTTGG